ncbi:MAG: hypothetical protein COA99_14940 [Moraxellaceae bacterium]|nr:MAG: hypothetical protein COA99_14940 [Moraxellaceae bacterium]
MIQKPSLKSVSSLVDAKAITKARHKQSESTTPFVTKPALYLEVRNRALEDLHSLVGEMFFQADDAFFDYAQKTTNDQDHDECMATMRELRLLRKGLERKLYQQIARLFKELPDPASALNKPTFEAIVSLDELSLVQNDDLEESVAIESMVARAVNSNATSLMQLTMRLDALTMGVTVTAANNPLSPKHLCEAFQLAAKDLACDIKYKLVIYKLFEQNVLKNFNKVADNSNCLLAKAGVLTDLKDTPRKLVKANVTGSKPQANKLPLENAEPINAQESTPSASDQAANVFFGQMQELMASIRGTSVSVGGAVVNPIIGSSLSSAKPINQAELVNVLSGMQMTQPSTENSIDASFENGQVASIAVREILASLLREREVKQGPEKVEEIDADLINLVSMLFDFILDDKCLPVAVKALIGRLQIPIIKVAMLDHSFLGRSGHPARKLLNELSRAGLGLSGLRMHLAKDPVYKKIQDVVQRVQNEFTNNIDIFITLEKDFSDFMNVEVRRSVLIEQRTKAAEEGKVKSEVARREAEQILTTCMEDKKLPVSVTKILNGPWCKVLSLSHLKEGGESRDFQKKVIIARHLIKSVTPPANDKERKYLYEMVPMLLGRLREGFESISFNPFEASELITALEAVQMEVLSGQLPQHIDKEPEDNDAVDNLLDAIAKDIPQISQSAKNVSSGVVAIDPSKTLGAAISTVELPALDDADDDYIAAKAVGVGSWVNINESPEKGPESAVRCKLAAYIKSADRMIFVNRSGIKVAEYSVLALAHAFKRKTIVIIDDALLFDRALENVIGGLRKIRHSSF